MLAACTSGQGKAERIPDTIDPAITPTASTPVGPDKSVGDAPEGVDEEQLDAQHSDALAIAEAEGRAQSDAETEARVIAVETSMARGFSEREDLVGTFIGKWLVENQPAREVLLALRNNDTAQMSIQVINDPSVATDETGTWVFEKAGVAAISLDKSGQLALRFSDGLSLPGSEFGDEGLPMLLHNSQ